MNKYSSLFTLLSIVWVLTSCGISYNIEGSSDISGLDSRMMYIKTMKNNELKDIDSTEVVHGKFGFSGNTDSVRIAYLVVGDANSLPIVLESGDINVKINKSRVEWGGTPLNDKLYRFVKTLDSLDVMKEDLDHEYNLAFMDGEDMNEVIPKLSRQYQQINMSIDTLVTQSIEENFDNILGPGIFMLITQQTQRYPEMSPWIVQIMSKATSSFKEDPYVRWFLQQAQYIQNVQNGLENSPASAQGTAQPEATPPTPNELAAPADSAAADTTARK